MNTKQLRQKILDLAIRGKLVPQDPTDEPASVLLEKIRTEREQLKEKKIKPNKKDAKSDKPHYQNMPFEVPEGWEWCMLGEIVEINPKNLLDDELDVSFVPMTMISDEFSNNHVFEVRKWKEIKKGFTHFREGDIGVAKITPCFENRKSVIFANLTNKYGAGTTELHILRPYSKFVLPQYLLWFVKSGYFIDNGISNFTGAVGQQRVGKNVIEITYFPIPPIEEQMRICSEIGHLFNLINIIEASKLDLLNVIKQTKQKVLDLAIHGKLVPQDPNDEPATVLLEQTKGIGKTTDIFPYPFEVPEGWMWCRLGDVFNVKSSKRVHKSEWKKSGIPFYRAREIVKLSQSNLVDNDLFISEEHYLDLKGKYGVPKENDILISAVGTIGKTYVVKNNDKFYYKDASVLCLSNIYSLNSSFVEILLASSIIQSQMYENSKGTTVDTITIEKANQYRLPIPPLAEQQRIVQKIENIFKQLDKIQESL